MSPRALSFLAVTFLVGARQAFNKGWSRGLMNGSWFLDLGAQGRGNHRTAVHVRLPPAAATLALSFSPPGPEQGRCGSRGGVWHVFLIRRAAAAGVREMAEIDVSLTKAGGDRGEASISSGVAAARGGGPPGECWLHQRARGPPTPKAQALSAACSWHNVCRGWGGRQNTSPSLLWLPHSFPIPFSSVSWKA